MQFSYNSLFQQHKDLPWQTISPTIPITNSSKIPSDAASTKSPSMQASHAQTATARKAPADVSSVIAPDHHRKPMTHQRQYENRYSTISSSVNDATVHKNSSSTSSHIPIPMP